MDFWDFYAKNMGFVTSSNDATISRFFRGRENFHLWPGTILVQIQNGISDLHLPNKTKKTCFKKIFLLAIIFSLKNYDLLPQVLECSNMAILPNLIVFTSCTKYCHKTLCSMTVKIYHKLPRFLLDYHNHNPFFSHSPLPWMHLAHLVVIIAWIWLCCIAWRYDKHLEQINFFIIFVWSTLSKSMKSSAVIFPSKS